MHESADTTIECGELTLYCDGATIEIEDARYDVSASTYVETRLGVAGLHFLDCRATLIDFRIGAHVVTRAAAVEMASEAEVAAQENAFADGWAEAEKERFWEDAN